MNKDKMGVFIFLVGDQFIFDLIFFLIFILYWSRVDLQSCVNFCCTAKGFSYTYTYILFRILFHDGLSQDIE